MKAAELFDLTGQVALVTGASSGLGVRFAEVLAANGASVALVARRAERLAAVKDRIGENGGRAVAIAADVLDRAAMGHAFDAAEAAFGTVTVLVNNAGVTHADRAIEIEETQWRRVMGTNLDAVLFWAQEAARRMIAAEKRGSIINVASILGFGVDKGLIAYSVAKAGVVQLTKGLALELAFKGVRVNAIAPGYVVTEINREFPGRSRPAVSARSAISTAHCCCLPPTPAVSWRGRQSWSTAARWSGCGGSSVLAVARAKRNAGPPIPDHATLHPGYIPYCCDAPKCAGTDREETSLQAAKTKRN